MNEDDIACFRRDLAAMGYRFQFISLAGYHMLNLSMYQFAKDYLQSGMTACWQVQQLELQMAQQLGHTRASSPESSGASRCTGITSAMSNEMGQQENTEAAV
jgi:isocitrate lyase